MPNMKNANGLGVLVNPEVNLIAPTASTMQEKANATFMFWFALEQWTTVRHFAKRTNRGKNALKLVFSN